MRIKPRRRLKREKPEPLAVPDAISQAWSMDFMHDQLQKGRCMRLLNVIDGLNLEGPGIEIDFPLPAERVVRSLEQIIGWRGCPKEIRCDNGPEYISARLQSWPEGKVSVTMKLAQTPQALLATAIRKGMITLSLSLSLSLSLRIFGDRG